MPSSAGDGVPDESPSATTATSYRAADRDILHLPERSTAHDILLVTLRIIGAPKSRRPEGQRLPDFVQQEIAITATTVVVPVNLMYQPAGSRNEMT